MKETKEDCDPKQQKSHNLGSWSFNEDLNDIFNGAHAVLILTEWQEYSILNWNKISKRMNSPAWIFDSRSILDPDNLKSSGLNFWRVGDGSENIIT